jgi:thiol-disulfide isomerase/thioredoxin
MEKILIIGLLTACAPRLYTDSVEDSGAGKEWVAPENTWTTNTPPSNLVSEGVEEGQVPPDFRLVDQFGDEVALWQFYGQWVVLDFSTLWCSPCQDLAALASETKALYDSYGFEYVSILSQNMNYEPPTLEEVQAWANAFDMDTPVLADPIGWTDLFVKGSSGFPRLVILDPEMRIVESEVKPSTDEGLRAQLDELL